MIILTFGSRVSAFLLGHMPFHTTSSLHQLPNHRLYHLIDWDKIEAGSYAVVDPVNPGSILYLSEQDYIVMIRVSITSNRTMKVLAMPGDTPVINKTSTPSSSDDPSSKSPPSPSGKETFAHPYLEGLASGNQKSGTTRARKRLQNLFNSLMQKYIKKTRKGSIRNTETSMITLSYGNVGKWFNQWHDLVSYWTRGKPISTVAAAERNSFGLRLRLLVRNNGTMALITRFKIMLFVVFSYLGGKKLTSTQDLGMRIRLINGLPALLPLYVRNGIRSHNRHFIHTWTSMLFSYKGIMGTWKIPNLWVSTITRAHPDYKIVPEFTEFRDFARSFWMCLKALGVRAPNLEIKSLFFTTHAGPNHPQAVLGSGLDASAWARAPRNIILEWLRATGQHEMAKQFRLIAKMEKLQQDIEASAQANKVTLLTSLFGMEREDNRKTGLILGRLHLLFEAAGKVRVVAIADYWTNAVLKPLHDWMFNILRKLPQDATFDQNGHVKSFAERGYNKIWSLDLKSATDLIPLALYRALFAWILPEKILSLWIDLLVDRPYYVPKEVLKEFGDSQALQQSGPYVHYRTGQPMGALTSWASMTLVHHAIVLFAARKVGVTTNDTLLNFVDYLVLGDDVVIANEAVALEYQRIMAALSVPIGLNKSFISEIGMFNFANQTYLLKSNYSPVSLREELGISSLPARAEMAMRMVRLGWTEASPTGWLAPVLKLFLGPNSKYWEEIRKDLATGRTHPLVSWILSALFVPGSVKTSLGLQRVSIRTYLAAMLREASIWSKPIESIDALISERRSEPLVLSILHKWINRIYKEFLDGRKRLASFSPWMESTTNVALEYVLKRLFEEQKSSKLQEWAENYRIPLKELQVVLQMKCSNFHTLEIGAGRNITQATELASEASMALPKVPDFLSMDIRALTGGLLDGVGGRKSQDRAINSFLRVAAALQFTEGLCSLATPGIDLTQDTSDFIQKFNPDLTSPNSEAK